MLIGKKKILNMLMKMLLLVKFAFLTIFTNFILCNKIFINRKGVKIWVENVI